MSKMDQEKKISTVRKQISQLQLRVQKLESSLHTLQTNPYHYFENLNTENREYLDWKNRSDNSKKDEELNRPMKKECGTTASTGAADNFRSTGTAEYKPTSIFTFYGNIWNTSQNEIQAAMNLSLAGHSKLILFRNKLVCVVEIF